MKVCREYRLSHSQFLSWSDADQQKAIEEFLLAAEACRSCGTRQEEWWPPGAKRPVNAYVPVVVECEGCKRINEARQWPEMQEDETGTKSIALHALPRGGVNGGNGPGRGDHRGVGQGSQPVPAAG